MAHSMPAWNHLLQLLALNWDPQAPAPRDPIPWQEVAYLAHVSGVSQLLYIPVLSSKLNPPPDVQAEVRHACHQVAAWNALHVQEWVRIEGAFARRGVRHLLLKGLALALTLYPDSSLRMMGDLDLAVAPQSVSASRAALIELGYAPAVQEEGPGIQVAYHNAEVFSHPEPCFGPIELHWHLFDVPHYLRRVPMDWFWANTRSTRVDDRVALVLNSEANLLYLSAHLALHHRFHGLIWYIDLAWLLHREGSSIDWKRLAAQAQASDLVLALRETLRRLAHMWPTLPLGEPLRLLLSLPISRTEERLFHLLTAEPRSPYLDFYTDIITLPDSLARARLVFWNVFPQVSYMAQRYHITHKWQLPYWYLLRLAQGARKAWPTARQLYRLRRSAS